MSDLGKKGFDFKNIVDEATMAICLVDPSGEIKYANRMAQDLLEFSLDSSDSSTSGQNVRVEQIYASSAVEKRVKGFNAETLEMQGLIQEILIQKLNARTFVATLGVKHVQFEGGRYVLLMIQDVTFQKKLQREINEKQGAIQQAYEELLKQNQMLKELDAAKDRFVAMTTHELRTPVSAVLAASEILKSKLYDNEEQHDEFLNMIFEQANHLLQLVNDILDFAKIQANKMDYYIEELNVVETIDREVEALKPVANSAAISLNFIKPTNPCSCYYDEVRLNQVITNLLSNAIKYNVPNGQVRIELKTNDDFVEIHIHDTGKGIDATDFTKIFSEFETLGKMGNHSKGTGLGLPISQRMIRRMGGEIQLTSEVGKGSTFWITVPRKRLLDQTDYRSRPTSLDEIAS